MKSISIELLQSQPQEQNLTNIVPNSDFINASQWTNLTNFSLSAGFMNKTVTSVGSFEQSLDTEEDFLYKLRVKFKNFNKSGKVVLKSAGINGEDVVIVDNTFNLDTGTTSAPSTQHIQDIQFVKGSTNTDKIVIEAEASTLIEISFVRMFLVSNADSQVLGVLDADTSKDFPLSLTFSINDVNNIDARNGLFSKTFEVPATANNNKLLKYFNVSSSTMFQAPIHRKIPCRIIVDNLISVAGLFQVKDVKKIRGVAVSYSCNFFGDNLSWATEIENLTLKDLELDNSTNLLISAEKILESWWSDNATSITNNDNVTSTNTSPIVYPIATYGSTNDNGFRHTMSLLRSASTLFAAGVSNFNADTVMIGSNVNNINHDPSMDWRPMIWVYRMIHKIFSNIGYTIESDFIESAEFKKLLFATPNFLFNNANQRYQNFSFLGNFQNNNCTLTGNAALDKPKFLFHKKKHLFRGTGSGNVLATSSGGTPQKIFYAPNDPNSGFSGTQIKRIRLADPDDCGTYTANEGGTKRFQPQIGDIVIGNNTLQQSTLIQDFGDGTSNNNLHNTFEIGESGYYRLTAKNFSYEIECNDGNGDGGYSGTGWSTNTGLSMFNQKNEIKLQGSFIFMVIRVGTTGRRGLGINASTSALVGEQDLGTWDATEQVGSGASQKEIRGNLDAVEVQAYLQKGDKVVLGFEFSNTFDATSFGNNGTALKVRTNTSGSQTHDCNFNMLLYGARQDAYTNSASASFGIELLNPERPEYMSTYNLSDVLPDNLKQLDFIKGLAHAFNLQFSTNTETKSVRIEPFTTFYENPSTAVDWTHKVDLSKEIKESFIDSGFKRKIIFKYKEDSNDKRVEDFAERFFESRKDAYPQILNLDDTFQVGETKFINPFFAGTWSAQNGYIGNNIVGNPNQTNSLQNPSVNFYSACLWENLYPNQSQGKGYKFQPRLLYYNKKTISDNSDLPYHRGASLEINTNQGLQIASLIHIMGALPTMPSGAGFVNKTVNDAGVSGNPRKAYLAYANSYDRYNFTNQFALTYGNYYAVDYDIATDTITINGNQVGLGLYERYYRQQIENLISHPKKKTVYVHLSSSDIRNLDFRKKIHINGVYYRLVKIIDYKPQLNETTKVELHQTDTKISGAAPIASQFINPNGDFEAPYEEDETNG